MSRPNSVEWFIEQSREAAVSVARTALVCPGMYHEGVRLNGAKQALAAAKKELKDAQAAWDKLVAPARRRKS